MRKVEVRSNIAGDIAKIRKGVVYKDYATVIDELLQNCQRAKAQDVTIDLDWNTLTIIDNGAGCADPQDLFEKNTSAWLSEDEAFGEGFFSVFLLADKLTVRSRDWELSVDILDMMKTQNMEIEVTEGLEIFDGFKVVMEGERISDNSWSLRQEVRAIAPVMALKVTLDKTEIQHVPMKTIRSDTEIIVDNDFFEGVLSPSRGFSTIAMFYEDRPVRDEYATGATGRLLLKKGKITLKAPDRKEFIYDKKLYAMKDELKLEVTKMYLDFIKTATDDELDTYEEAISEYLKVEEYASLLSISKKLFEREDQEDEEEPDHSVPKWTDNTELYKMISSMEQEQNIGETSEERQARESGMLEKLISQSKKLVYVPVNAGDKYEKKIREAQYAGFTLIYARNRLYEKAFEYYGICGVDDFQKMIDEEYVIGRPEAKSRKEQRFLVLMNIVEKHYEMEKGSIQLADLSRVVKLRSTGEIVSEEKTEVHGLCKISEGKVYLDRKIVRFPEYRAQEPDYPSITAHDYKVMLRVTQTLSHELAHLLYGYVDNTMEHSNAMVKIGYEIAELF